MGGRHLAGARKSGDRGPRARDELRRPDKQADFMRRDSVAEPGLDGLADCVGFRGDGGEGFHFGRRSVEHRDDPAAFVFHPVSIAQDRRQQPVGGATDLLRGAVADLERVRSAPHIDAEARPRKRMLENALPDIAREEQAIRLRRRQGREEPQLRRGQILRFIDDDMVEWLAGPLRRALPPGR